MDSQNEKGQTPLMVATKWKNLEVFHLLLKHSSADTLNLRDVNLHSLAHYVCQKNLREFLLCLYGTEVDMTVRDKYGLLPFELCNDSHTHSMFPEFSSFDNHPLFGGRVVRGGKLQLASRFDNVRDALERTNDYRHRVRRALEMSRRSKDTTLSTDISRNGPKSFKLEEPEILLHESKNEYPGEFLADEFDFDFPFVAEHLKHCNEFKSFKFQKPIGVGGFGEVWRVLNRNTQQTLAAKVINLKCKVRPKTLRNLVRIERDIMQDLDHPFVVKCLYSFKSQRRFYLFMEYCPFRDLGFLSRIVLHGFQPRMVKLFLAEIVLAIGHLHANGIIHRDLKTENVLVDATGHTKLTGTVTLQSKSRLWLGKKKPQNGRQDSLRHTGLQFT